MLSVHPRIAAFFEEAVALHGDAVKVANFVQTEVLRDVATAGLSATFPVTAAQVAELLALVDGGTISGKQAKDVYAALRGTAKSARDVVAALGVAQMSDSAELESVCKAVVEANAKQVAGYRSGKTGLIGFFVGQVMKETKGSANPQLVNEILARLLAG